jgi:signal transduction histidine kinase
MDSMLESICLSIQQDLGFDFVAIQLVRDEEQIIETVSGTGSAADWTGRVKHYVIAEPIYRDIQVDVLLQRQIEVISGWDSRFDRWVFETYGHGNVVRAFAPILIARGPDGQPIHSWESRSVWEVVSEQTSDEGCTTTLRMGESDDPLVASASIEAIGTIEAGYQDRSARIPLDLAIRLAESAAQAAMAIRRATLHAVLEKALGCAMEIAKADSGGVNYLYDPGRGRYVYQCALGRHWQELKSMHPREDRLGRMVTEKRVPIVVSATSGLGSELGVPGSTDGYLDALRGIEVQTVAAFPLMVNGAEGVLYLHLAAAHAFTHEEFGAIDLFLAIAADAIRGALTFTQMRDQMRQLSSLHKVFHSLVSIEHQEMLLKAIASNTLNILAADVVTIHEYSDTDHSFVGSPETAGRTAAAVDPDAPSPSEGISQEILAAGRPVFIENLGRERVFSSVGIDIAQDPFVTREKIASVAGLVLKAHDRVVGIMVIYYRLARRFSDDDKRTIDALASSAAISIENKRLVRTLSWVNRQIIASPSLDSVLGFLLHRAIQIAGASEGEVYHLHHASDHLDLRARHPQLDGSAPRHTEVRLGDGVIGSVAQSKEPMMADDARSLPMWGLDAPKKGSLLCIPLLDSDSRVLGVISVRTLRTEAFSGPILQTLQSFGDQAVIAIQQAESYRQLDRANVLSDLGNRAGPVVHRMTGEVGGIEAMAQEIRTAVGADPELTALCDGVIRATRVLLREAEGLQNLGNNPLELVQVSECVSGGLGHVSLPAGVEVSVSELSGLPMVRACKAQLVHVFEILFQNAVEAMPGGGRLTVLGARSQRGAQEWVVVRVSDSGVGIAPDAIDRVFEYGYTHKPDKVYSMGLGLWWARAYVERMCGELSAQSRVGQGSTFTIVLPVPQGGAQAEQQETTHANHSL